MSTVQKVALGIVGIGLATTLVLNGHQTVGVIGAFSKLFNGALHTSITGNS